MAAPYEVRTATDWALRAEENLRIAAMQPHKLGWLLGFDKLNPLHSQWIRYIWDSNEHRALQAFRGSYKTTSVVVVGTVRWMLFHPNDRILLTRKAFKPVAEVTRAISRAMQTREIAELFKQAHGRYPKSKVDREGNLTYTFKTKNTVEGNVTGMGIDQGITGYHFDKIVGDDVMTLRDRISRAERERTHEMIRELATNIIDPGQGSGWTGTPWHGEDAWKTIRTFSPIWRCPISKYNVFRDNNGAHRILTEEMIRQKKRTTTPYLYAANYELELGKDESLLFTDPVYPRRWDYAIRGAKAQLDTAFDGDHYCALTIAAPIRKENGQQIYQAVGFVFPGHVRDFEEKVEMLCRKYQVKELHVEKNADQGESGKRLAARGLRVKPYAEGMNKHIKISSYLYPVWPYIEWSVDTDEEYLSQVLDYKMGVEPDDAPDSAGSLFREAFPQVLGVNKALFEY